MRKVRCRNCGALQDVPDHHGPLHIACKTCEWQETLPPRRELPTELSQFAGSAFAARRLLLKRSDQLLAHLPELHPHELEDVCGRLYERLGFVVERVEPGNDQTHAFEIRRGDEISFLACRRAGARPVDASDIENLAGDMRHGTIKEGIFVTTGSFADACAEIAKAAGIELIDGDAFRARLASLDPAELDEIVALDEETLIDEPIDEPPPIEKDASPDEILRLEDE